MIETTVTMSLERYKFLEAIEDAHSRLKKGEDFVSYYDSYDVQIRIYSKDDAIHKAVADYSAIKQNLDNLKAKIHEYADVDKKSKIKEFLRDLLY